MSDTKTTLALPVHLSLPLDAPKLAKGCGVCAALVKQHAAAQAKGDLSAATDCNVELAADPHRRAADWESA